MESRQTFGQVWKAIESRKASQIIDKNCCEGGRVIEYVLDDNGYPVKTLDHGKCQDCDGDDGGGLGCAICKEWSPFDAKDLDFHHWDYDGHVGTLVCRDCHDKIHATQESFPDADNWKRSACYNAILHADTLEEDRRGYKDLLSWLNLPTP